MGFHKKYFKAYLCLRETNGAEVARKIGMSPFVFNNKTNGVHYRKSVKGSGNVKSKKHNSKNYFHDDEKVKIIRALSMSDEWQVRIFDEVLVPISARKDFKDGAI